MSLVAGSRVYSLCSVRSSLPPMKLPNHPTIKLMSTSAATPNCRLRYLGERWLTVFPRIIRYVAERNVIIRAAK